ncbi:hypothetical protein L3V82_11370 [Thiotrichales bacterium 19S3-7]|nr:hypothetical protein [Thiotrichales bacterium 19S3-7]MCF6802813.1 hypothetical protein [Thiotrichales bacterium 19S3-11]
MQVKVCVLGAILGLMLILTASNVAYARFGGGRSFGHFSRSYTHSYRSANFSRNSTKGRRYRNFNSRSSYGIIGLLAVLSLILHGSSSYVFLLIVLTAIIAGIAYLKYKSKNNIYKRQLPETVLPDGSGIYELEEIAYKLFMELQQLTNQKSRVLIKNYLTESLFNEMKAEIEQNNSTAEFKNLQWRYLGSQQSNSKFYASVAFKGLVKENDANWVYFNEIWCFLNVSADKWLLAGIKQVN